jgi:hypothetical protein
VDETHETPVRYCVPEGFGVGWIVQLVPSHRSAKVLPNTPKAGLSVELPTAVHAEAEEQDTAPKALPRDPDGSGTD